MAVPSDLATLDAVKAWGGVPGTLADAQIAGLITSVSRAIYSRLQRPNILPATYTEVLRLPPSNQLLLKAWPVISVSSVTIGPTTVPAANPAWQANGYVLETVDPSPPSRPQTLYLGGWRGYDWGGGRGYGYGSGLGLGASTTVVYTAGYQYADAQTVASGALTAAQPYGAWASDQGVTYATSGAALSQVTGSPAQGQYALTYVNGLPGGYAFNAADDGASVVLSYGYIPADLTQALIEWAALRFKAQAWIGLKSKSLGGQETVAFDTGAIPDFVAAMIQPYRRVAIC